PVQRDLGAGGGGRQGAIGRRGLVQEDGGRGDGGAAAGGVLVPGVEGLGAIAGAEGIAEGADVAGGGGHGSPAHGRGRRGRGAGGEVVAGDADGIGGGGWEGHRAGGRSGVDGVCGERAGRDRGIG